MRCLLPIWICQPTLVCIPAFLSCMYVYDLAFLGNCLAWVTRYFQSLPSWKPPTCHIALVAIIICKYYSGACDCSSVPVRQNPTHPEAEKGNKRQQPEQSCVNRWQQSYNSYLTTVTTIHTSHQSYLIRSVTPGKRMKKRARSRLQCQQVGGNTLSKVMRMPEKARNRVGGYNWAHKVDPVK